MQFGIHLGSMRTTRRGEVADRCGSEPVWIPEHLVVPVASSGSLHAVEGDAAARTTRLLVRPGARSAEALEGMAFAEEAIGR